MKHSKWICFQIWSLLFLALFLGTCHSFGAEEVSKVLIVRPNSAAFKTTHNGLLREMDEGWAIETYKFAAPNLKKLKNILDKFQPDIVVLMGNGSVNLWRRLQSKVSSTPPALALMAVFLDQHINQLDNIVGIPYEIPALTSLVNLRNLSKKPIRKVGVLYRKGMRSAFLREYRLCLQEQIFLIGQPLPNQSHSFSDLIRQGVRALQKEEIDALWVFNDSTLLSSEMIINGWHGALLKSDLPVVVGVESLIKSSLKFGSLAVMPDHAALGVQAADLLYEWRAGELDFDSRIIFPPISIRKVLNAKLAETWLEPGNLDEVDETIH